MNSRSHLGTCFEVWNGDETWFWFIVDPHRNGAAIGAAPTEAQAVREACLSIEEWSAQRRAGAATLRVNSENTAGAALYRSNSFTLAARGWEYSLAKLQRYLTCVCGAAG